MPKTSDFEMKTVELFAGTGSFSKVAKELGHETFTVDIDAKQNPDLVYDLNKPFPDILLKKIDEADLIWLSPPCTTFSVASISRHWTKEKIPKTEECIENVALILKCLRLCLRLRKGQLYFLENPRGMARTIIKNILPRKTVTYCQYGFKYMKPTDIWTNLDKWEPKCCRNGDNCHISAPRGSRSGLQGLKSLNDRYKIPPALFYEIFENIEKCTTTTKQ